MTSIFPKLIASLQNKLAQYALLQHRAAVLAVLPPGKGRAARRTAQPPPELLKTVVFYAGQEGTPRVGQVVLRAWFQKKTELRAVVRRALYEAGYPVPPLAAGMEPSPWNVRLAPHDVLHQGDYLFFGPNGQRVPHAADASLEEITLMAHLLGWTVLAPTLAESPPEVPALGVVAAGHGRRLIFWSALGILAREALPPEVAAAVQRGELPAGAAPYWGEHWPDMITAFEEMRTAMQLSLGEPCGPATAPLILTEFDDLLHRLELQARATYCGFRHRVEALALLARVDRLRHRQQADFAPLATLRARNAAVRVAFAAEWPLNEATGLPATVLPRAQTEALVAQAAVYEPLLHLVDQPEALADLDETSEDFRRLEAVLPPAALNALLLRKLDSTG